ncbi:MAG: AI-2E family transporter [Deltaproteobacteria bacterium]|nr:AI-2E family transporter [Deltaproteobacteria bacterium]MBW1959006.1 AI-2E family transporter [Deltaproteobacteria bacterium]MBW2013043.1 AI-2E family transporter [Deltaproteobacteria bacterium]MBW2089279.1 AI-2E family transporter [Deltaproteobacteria bacterium]MBW2320858.1 AI-2E family transporter [Deltaproteobacteria bacterium]
MPDRTSHNIILWFFLALFLVSAFFLGRLFWPFMSVIVLAAVVTGIFKPVYKFLNKKMNSLFASLLTCSLIFFILFIPTILFVGILSKEAYDLYLMGKGGAINDQIKPLLESSRVLERINLVLSNLNMEITGEELNKAISELGKFVGLFLFQQASSIASNVFKFFVYFFFMLLIIYYLLFDGDKLIAFIIDLSPLPKEQDEKLIQKFKDMAGAILIGNGLCGLIQGVAGGIVFFLFGFNSPFLWGVIMALLAFLPIIGIGVVFIPVALYLFLKMRIASGIFFVVFYIILSGGIEYLLKPKLVGQRVKMHTLLVFFSIIGGLKMFGILGIIYGPLVATAFLTLTDIYYTSYQKLVDPVRVEDCKD